MFSPASKGSSDSGKPSCRARACARLTSSPVIAPAGPEENGALSL